MSRDDVTSAAPAGEHPSADALADYAVGTLPSEDQQQVRDHLEDCAECHGLVLDLSSYPELEPPDASYRVSDQELRASLGALRARVLEPLPEARRDRSKGAAAPEPEARSSPQLAPVPVADRAPRRPHSPANEPVQRHWQPLLAAAVVLLAFGWGWQRGAGTEKLRAEVAELQNRLSAAESELQRPWVNVRVARLLADDDPLRGSPAPSLSLGRTGSTVLIQTPEPLPAGRYTGEIRGPGGEVVLRIEGLEPQNVGLSFFLPAAALEPGEYRMWLLQGDTEVYPTPFELRVSE